MTIQIALLRGINVGGKHRVPMAELRTLLEAQGLTDPRTLLQSGNAVFDAGRKSAASVETMLEAALHKQFGFAIDFMVRSAAEWQRVIDDNPFADAAKKSPGHFIVMFLKHKPTAKQVAAATDVVAGPEEIQFAGREAYIIFPNGIGKSKLNFPKLEKQIGCSGTMRNWNTVLKLAELAKAQ